MKHFFARILSFAFTLPLMMGFGAHAAADNADKTGKTAESDGHNGAKTRVACVGDSITYGLLASKGHDYPTRLQEMLGEKYDVRNFGVGGAALMCDTVIPYRDTPEYAQSLDFMPDVVIIMLGTNETAEYNFERLENFERDLIDFVGTYSALDSAPEIYFATAPYACTKNELDTGRINNTIVDLQRAAIPKTPAKLIDIAAETAGKEFFYLDGIHPDDGGYGYIAYKIFNLVFGGRLNEVTVEVPSGTVVRCDRYAERAVDGCAALYLPKGDFTLELSRDGFFSEKRDISVNGDMTVKVEMKMGSYNVSLKAPVVASSADADMPAEFAVDGSEGSRWCASLRDGQWIQVDLGHKMPVFGIKLFWEIAFARGYSVCISDNGHDWSEIWATDDGHGAREEISFPSVLARFIRIDLNDAGTMYTYSLYEIEVQGSEKPADFDERNPAIVAEAQDENDDNGGGNANGGGDDGDADDADGVRTAAQTQALRRGATALMLALSAVMLAVAAVVTLARHPRRAIR